MTTFLGIILGGAGIVFGVIALMVSAEMSRRVTRLIDSRFQRSELELMKGLDKQDRELKRQRRVLGDALEDIEARFKAQSEQQQQMQAVLDQQKGLLDEVRGVRRVVPTDEERGFSKSGSSGEFERESPFIVSGAGQ